MQDNFFFRYTAVPGIKRLTADSFLKWVVFSKHQVGQVGNTSCPLSECLKEAKQGASRYRTYVPYPVLFGGNRYYY